MPRWVVPACAFCLLAVSSANAVSPEAQVQTGTRSAVLPGMSPVASQSGAPATGRPPPSSEAEGLIFERQQVMDQLKRDSEVVGDIVAGLAPPARLAASTRAIARGARDSLEMFRRNVPGGDAKPEVWSNHDDYMRRMENFATAAEAMAKAGETGNVAAVTELLTDAMPCKQCHDTYRERRKHD